VTGDAPLTKTVALRLAQIERKRAQEAEAARRAAEEEAERARKADAARAAVAPLIAQLEAQRRPMPLAWQPRRPGVVDTVTAARERFQAEAEARSREAQARIKAAETNRPFLFLGLGSRPQRSPAELQAAAQQQQNHGPGVGGHAPAAKQTPAVNDGGDNELFDLQGAF
jgi:hypothetical protein